MLRVKSKFKIGKRLGASVFEKCQTQKFVLSEARKRKVRGGKRRGPSDYGKQMLEKQKVRYTYGLIEKQFRRYIDAAMRVVDSPAAIHAALEQRLDNVVYRAGLAPTRRAARQMVTHGHITVNGRRANTPSRHVPMGDEFAVRSGSRQSVLFAEKDDDSQEARVPKWISFDRKTLSGKVIAIPSLTADPMGFDYGTVFEFYSR
jgi:small subunit ribosomal protein S4